MDVAALYAERADELFAEYNRIEREIQIAVNACHVAINKKKASYAMWKLAYEKANDLVQQQNSVKHKIHLLVRMSYKAMEMNAAPQSSAQ